MLHSAVVVYEASQPGTTSAPAALQYVIAAVLIAAGLLNIVKPDVGWRMSKWQFRNQEAMQPSPAALTYARVLGVVAVIAGLALTVFRAFQ